MNRVTLRKYLENKSLFSTIDDYYTLPLDSELGLSTYDRLLVIDFGDRYVSSAFIGVGEVSLAKLLVSRFSEKWDNYLLERGVVNEGIYSKVETAETISEDENTQRTGVDTDKVAAFNSDSLITEGGRENTSNDETGRERVRNTVVESKNPMQALKMLREGANSAIIERVNKDIVNFICLSIY